MPAEINIANLIKFHSTPANRQMIAEVRQARKHAATIRAHVNSYIDPIFRDMFAGITDDSGCELKCADDLWLCDDEALCDEFYAACDRAHAANGYDLAPGYCPALAAEHGAALAESALIHEFSETFGEPFDRIGGDKRERLVDLLLNAPR